MPQFLVWPKPFAPNLANQNVCKTWRTQPGGNLPRRRIDRTSDESTGSSRVCTKKQVRCHVSQFSGLMGKVPDFRAETPPSWTASNSKSQSFSCHYPPTQQAAHTHQQTSKTNHEALPVDCCELSDGAICDVRDSLIWFGIGSYHCIRTMEQWFQNGMVGNL